ncbi:transcriptional regulator [Amycolatopsis balhimycina DSM 5908]|uniref:Transcriptional regulator n=1 Tax=Amycolatopsis balhimycina DSM 5908 TaxID=1081091 RepID=A0A428VRS9_AMYBA|nr:helix-turn-helix transcriptional regulator [Amycolatopsis balhimycina]RSM33535.1 transcriptional regulator [Amycolatopsis balhimycina DSM 5908]
MTDSNGGPNVPSDQERLFAVEVSRARATAKVSQDWLGRRINLSRGKVSEVCGGWYLPSRETVALLIEALGMERERTLRLWQDARDAAEQRRKLERFRRRAGTPVGWDRRPVLPAEVLSLVRAQVQVGEEFPYRLPGARQPSLATVYVRQELGSEPEEPQPVRRSTSAWPAPTEGGDHDRLTEPRPGGDTRPGPLARRRAMRAPSLAVREALDGSEHLLVTGGPGQGKSTLTLRLAADIARIWAQRDEDVETVTAGESPLDEPVIPLRVPATGGA